MRWWKKLRQAAAATEPAIKIASVGVPGKGGDIARIIERIIDNDRDPNNLGALRALANEIVELKMRVDHLEQVITQK